MGAGLLFCLTEMQCISLADPGPSDIASGQERAAKPDVVLFATPIAVRAPTSETAIDALERSPDVMGSTWKVVVFRIERVVKGNFKPLRVKKGPSAMDQAKEASKEKNILKLLTMDFERPDETPQGKNCFSMAVVDPAASLGLQESETFPKQSYRISLSLIQKNPESYVLVKSEKLS